ncbi:MAG TPA: hypothetical protein VMS71_00115 [Candidatus Acidoferrum sp.]|nr:hypothetical protein [Candidatus Acidoferrum sp.]
MDHHRVSNRCRNLAVYNPMLTLVTGIDRCPASDYVVNYLKSQAETAFSKAPTRETGRVRRNF